MQRCPMTPASFSTLEKELKHLREVIRPEVVKQIEEARAHGDLSENAEYDAAKDRQGMTEARLRHVETQLATAEVIDVQTLPESNLVVFGSTVDLLDVETDEELSYRLVGQEEASVKNGDVSFDSPVGRALLGKREGDEAKVIGVAVEGHDAILVAVLAIARIGFFQAPLGFGLHVFLELREFVHRRSQRNYPSSRLGIFGRE